MTDGSVITEKENAGTFCEFQRFFTNIFALKSANLVVPSFLTLGYFERGLCFSDLGNGEGVRRKKDLSWFLEGFPLFIN